MANPRLCSVPDCNKPHSARGLCRAHYAHWNRNSKPIKCSVDGCHNPSDRLGFCTAHYMRARRNDGNPTAGRCPPKSRESFVLFAAQSETDECIIWPFPANPKTGYGLTKVNGRSSTAHRAVLSVYSGLRPPNSVHAAHAPEICHNRLCVNPRHLRWATRVENEADKRIDGTHLEGHLSPRAKFTPDDVLSIRKDGRTSAEIARAYGVSEFAISSIRKGRTYRNVAADC